MTGNDTGFLLRVMKIFGINAEFIQTCIPKPSELYTLKGYKNYISSKEKNSDN